MSRSLASGQSPSARRWQALRWGATVAGLAYLFASIFGVIPFTLQLGAPPGLDTYTYWAADMQNLYATAIIGSHAQGAYLYSPAFAQAFSPLRPLPFEVVYALWLSLCLGLLAWMRVLWFVVLPPVIAELYFGNVHILYAAVIVAGFGSPGLWALTWLTKVTPGIGSLWFAFTRKWRSLALAVGSTALIVFVRTRATPVGGLGSEPHRQCRPANWNAGRRSAPRRAARGRGRGVGLGGSHESAVDDPSRRLPRGAHHLARKRRGPRGGLQPAAQASAVASA